MPLSEHEQRLLDEMERSLYHSEADDVTTVGAGRVRANYTAIALGVIAGAVGIVLLLAGVISRVPLIGLLGFAVMFGGVALGGEPLMKALAAVQAMNGDYAMPDKVAYLLFAMGLAAIAIQFGFTIWLGMKKGDSGNNRFGAPPEDIFKRS